MGSQVKDVVSTAMEKPFEHIKIFDKFHSLVSRQVWYDTHTHTHTHSCYWFYYIGRRRDQTVLIWGAHFSRIWTDGLAIWRDN